MADILELIDNAIEDYELSADAMRWTPEVPQSSCGGRGQSVTYGVLDETHSWRTVDFTTEAALFSARYRWLYMSPPGPLRVTSISGI